MHLWERLAGLSTQDQQCGLSQSQKGEKQKERDRDQKTGDMEIDGDTGGMLMEGVETKKGTDFRVGALRRKSEDIATAWL